MTKLQLLSTAKDYPRYVQTTFVAHGDEDGSLVTLPPAHTYYTHGCTARVTIENDSGYRVEDFIPFTRAQRLVLPIPKGYSIIKVEGYGEKGWVRLDREYI